MKENNEAQHNGMHRHHWYGALMRPNAYDIKEIMGFLEIKKEWDIVDLGCDGFFSKGFFKYGKSFTAIDINPTYFTELNKLGIITKKANLCNFSEGGYDLTFMSNVYHGSRQGCKESVIKAIGNITKKYFAIMDFNEKRLFGATNARKERNHN
ncbi:MAG: hypothetical protein ACP5MW_00335 [Thermoplasmata archaeon]